MQIMQTEDQQLVGLKEYFVKYRRLALIVIAVLLAVIVAGRYWQHHKLVRAAAASDLYEEMLIADHRQDLNTLTAKGNLLVKSYSSTPYGQFAGMLLAKQAVNEGHLEQAEQLLRTVIGRRKSSNMSLHVATVRLAKVLMQQGKIDEALTLVAAGPGKGAEAYATIYEEAKGDLYVAKGDTKLAKESYINALKALPDGAAEAQFVQLLQLKLLDLGVGENDA